MEELSHRDLEDLGSGDESVVGVMDCEDGVASKLRVYWKRRTRRFAERQSLEFNSLADRRVPVGVDVHVGRAGYGPRSPQKAGTD